MSVDISVSITEDVVDIIATPTVNIVNVTNSASIDPGLYDLSEFTNTSVNPFVRTSGLSAYVPTTRTLTINGTTQDLSADRTFTVSTGITIGTTAITSGTVGRVLFEGTGNVVQESANLFWDNTNGRLGIGTSSPAYKLSVAGSIDAGANFIGYGLYGQGIFPQGPSGELRFVNGSGGGWFYTWVQNGSERMRLTTGNNLLINTTTDAGFKLDVNGTARLNNSVIAQTVSSVNVLDISNIRIADDGNGRYLQAVNGFTLRATATPTTNFITLSSNLSNSWKTTQSISLSPSGGSGGVLFSSSATAGPSNSILTFLRQRNDSAKSAIINTEDFASSGNVPINMFIYAGKETVLNNQANLILCHDGTSSRGKLLVGTSTAGASVLRMVGLPTSPAGLSSGDVWNNLGILTIV